MMLTILLGTAFFRRLLGVFVMSCGGESFFPAVLTITHGIALSR